MYIKKQVQIVKINTMSDGTIRLTIDLLNGDANDISNAFSLTKEDTTMILAPTDILEATS